VPYEGQELEGPNGIRLRFVLITDEVLEMEQTYSGEAPLPPAHLHPMQDERFEVLDGAVRTVIGDTERRYAAGEVFEVPAGTSHQMGGDGAARIKWEVRPALGSAHFFEELYTGTAASDPAAFLERYSDEFRLVAAS
jgi:quercetin dioxygenase-like cupin family protein